MNGNKKNIFPMPMMGNQQIQIDLKDVERKTCNACHGEFFDKAFRMGILSKFAPANHLKQDITVEYPVYVCRKCGYEFNKEIKVIG
jgi:hypothetical protein